MSQRQIIVQYLKKPEFWLGFSTLLVAALILGVNIANRIAPHPKEATKTTTSVGATITSIEERTPKPTPTSALTKIAQLANTSGEATALVVEGDSFWRISVRMCGTGVFYRSIQAYNGYTDADKLHSGETVRIVCQ